MFNRGEEYFYQNSMHPIRQFIQYYKILQFTENEKY